jgi:hypothetical protein
MASELVVAVFPVNVLLVTVRVPQLRNAPPFDVAVFPVNVLVFITTVPSSHIAPP